MPGASILLSVGAITTVTEMKQHCLLVALLYLSGIVLPLKAQTDTLDFAPGKEAFTSRLVSSRAFRITCIGVPLVAGGLVIRSEDDHFHSLRNDYMPHFHCRADDYLQYLPAVAMLGMKLGGVEGAYFFNPYVGLGGRFAVSNASVIGNGRAQGETMDMMFMHTGLYFSYPLSPRFLIGSKALIGLNYCPPANSSVYVLKNHWGAGIGTGISFTFRAKEHLGIRLYTDYNLFDNCLLSDKTLSHLLIVGGAVGITL